jgi:hypothetical protein
MAERHVIDAYAFAEMGELARRAAHYDAAIGFGRSAWRAVERDGAPAAVEAFLMGTRVESWGWQMTDHLDWALLIAELGRSHARRHAPGTLLTAWAEERVHGVKTAISGRQLTPALTGFVQLADALRDGDKARELRFVSLYGALGAAAKLGAEDAGHRAEAEADAALAEAGSSEFEHAFRSQQAIFAIRTGRFDQAHRFIEENHAANERRGRRLGPQFVLAHLFLASGEREEGVDVLQAAVDEAAARENWQSLRAALRFMDRYLEPGAIRVPTPGELPPRLSPASLN